MRRVRLRSMKHRYQAANLSSQVLSDQGIPLSVEQLYILLDIHADEREIFNKRLNAHGA